MGTGTGQLEAGKRRAVSLPSLTLLSELTVLLLTNPGAMKTVLLTETHIDGYTDGLSKHLRLVGIRRHC